MNEQNGYDIEDLQVGMTATFAKTITEADMPTCRSSMS
jgi:3-hydroxybutyryl-CoA dehydratase